MGYFLKKTKNKKGTYLQIYESFWNPEKGHTSQKSFRPIGYIHELKEQGIEDPITHFKEEVQKLNDERRREKADTTSRKRIDKLSPEKHLGYFVIESIDRALGIDASLNALNLMHAHDFDVVEVLHDFVYARAVNPSSKSQTFDSVLPTMERACSYSKSQMYEAIEFIGAHTKQICEAYTKAMQRKGVGLDFTNTYFDCTNFYFEIDFEDEFRRKGPSKENRSEPLVSLALLLDANQIPVGLETFAGNESEKPQLRELMNKTKRKLNITSKTIQVADKGLNCTDNILAARKAGDGYIFSRSLSTLAAQERNWALNRDDMTLLSGVAGEDGFYYKEIVDEFSYTFTLGNKRIKVPVTEKRVVTYSDKLHAKKCFEIDKEIKKCQRLSAKDALRKSEGHKSKYLNIVGVTDQGEVVSAQASLNQKAIDKDKQLAGYNMYVSSETDMSVEEILNAYRGLWRIEESFRVLKTSLDLRPVYLQKPDSIRGHVLICYITLLLTRLLQIRVLKDHFSSQQVVDFMRDFKLTKLGKRGYLNITKASELTDALTAIYNAPIDFYELSTKERDSLFRISSENLIKI